MSTLSVLAIVVLIAAMIAACSLQKSGDPDCFSAQPSISDEEYCALMPGISREVALGVRDVLVDASGWDREEIHPKTRLIEFELL